MLAISFLSEVGAMLEYRAGKGWAMKRTRQSKKCDAVDWDKIES